MHVGTAIVLGLLLWRMVGQARTDSGLGERAREQSVSEPAKRVILITIDALRTDALSCYNSNTKATKHIDSLGADGVVFGRAVSAASWTLPSLASIMTGTNVLVHQVRQVKSVLPERFHTLAEYMRDAGYFTGAIGDNPYLRNTGLDQGFDTYNVWPKGDKIKPPTTEGLTERVMAWLDEHGGQEFFFWVHYLDPHMPYEPPVEYRREAFEAAMTKGQPKNMPTDPNARFPWCYDDINRDRLVKGYVGELQYVDDTLGILLAYLKERGLYEDTLIILSSDHGDEFWDHGQHGHGQNLYHSVLSVPLIVKLPGPAQSKFIEQSCGTVSLAPTILDVCGIEYVAESFSGPSLRELWRRGPSQRQDIPVFSLRVAHPTYDRHAITWGDYKYMRWTLDPKDGYVVLRNRERAPAEELYDLEKDPCETRSIADDMPERIAEVRVLRVKMEEDAQRLHQYHQVAQPQDRVLDEKTVEDLKALGYLQ